MSYRTLPTVVKCPRCLSMVDLDRAEQHDSVCAEEAAEWVALEAVDPESPEVPT